MRSTNTIYVTSSAEYDKHRRELKCVPCPHCRIVGYLNRHGYLKGCGDGASDRVQRGWRILCCNRDRRRGCGRTYCVLLTQFMPHRMVDSSRLWHLLKGLRQGMSLKAAWEKISSPFCLETGYRIRGAFVRNQTFVRSLLLRAGSLPRFSADDPTMQVIEHLRAVFRNSACPVADFQLHFQTAFLHAQTVRVNRSG